ncbi:MAG: hypothetical protein HY689_02195 [Chloroflexi bacterium]|nr:hypothetical protein [Chloroflexota bacterium]
MQELSADQVRRLAEDVRSKILAKQSLLAQAEGEITIRIFRRNTGFDIKLTVTTE